MKIEDNIFKKYNPDFEKLEAFGFIKSQKGYVIEKDLKHNAFKAVITIHSDGKIESKVFEKETNEEFLPLRIENNQGAFVGEIRADYEETLTEIRNNCFNKNYFVLPQSNRITAEIIKKYKNEPEFLWEKYDGTGIFRNPKTDKWFAIIMDVDKSKIVADQKGFCEVLGLKLTPNHVEEITKEQNFYKAYHLNKKHWITIILDESVSDKKIMELIEESHSLTEKKKKRN